jgi:hypothetical protein
VKSVDEGSSRGGRDEACSMHERCKKCIQILVCKSEGDRPLGRNRL